MSLSSGIRCGITALACLMLAGLAPASAARIVEVTDVKGLEAAIKSAEPGDDIVLADGSYEVRRQITVAESGSRELPITVRAAHRWKAQLRSSTVVAFEVVAENWRFRDLDIRGTCGIDAACEHAFHVVGNAASFVMAGNRIADFNAHLKVNAVSGVAPSGGLVEGNELFNTHPRETTNTVALLNIDAASAWVIRNNLIYDFNKAGGDAVSYGAYVKGGAERPVIERNVVICRRKDRKGGARIGLSFGGGGTGAQYCAPNYDAGGSCDQEVIGGVMRNNIVADCSDVGIYLNQSTNSLILFNTLIRTRGIDFRFPGSTGEARGNLMASEIRTRDGGKFTDGGNLMRTRSDDLEELYQDPDAGDLRLRGKPTLVAGKGGADPRVTDDFCGRKRNAPLDMGALQSSLGDCPTLP